MNPVQESDSDREARRAADCRLANDTALAEVQKAFGLTWPAGVEYRATARSRGTISGLDCVGQLEILCTDGVVAWFCRVGTKKVFQGHISHFSGDVVPAFSLSTEKKESLRKEPKKKKKHSLLEEALRVLDALR